MRALLYILLVNYLILHVHSHKMKYYIRGQSRYQEMEVADDDDSDSDSDATSDSDASSDTPTIESRHQSKSKSERPGSAGKSHRNKPKHKLKLSTPDECARECVLGAKPKNCYYHFTVEFYRTLGGACTICQPTTNTSLSSDCQCIQTDGVDMSGIMVANRQYPGPSIQVCLGDLIIVDLTNKAPGTGITIHWHGIYQKDYQYYDGVPFVTQCPVVHGSTFRYQFPAQNSGTHFWHAHTGLHKPDGLEGAIVIRPPKSLDPNKQHYDQDNFDNIIFLNDWFHESAVDHWPGTSIRNVGQIPANVLINGKGRWRDPATNTTTNVPLAVINVEPKKRIRFRIINSLSWTCPVQLTFEKHTVAIIGTDGEDVQPKNVTTLTSFSAERIDIVLYSYQPVSTYWIQARLTGGCASRNISQVAILRYIGSNLEEPESEQPQFNPGLPLGVVFNPLNNVCNNGSASTVCVKDLDSADPINDKVTAGEPTHSVFIPFNFHTYSNEEIYTSTDYQHFQVPGGRNASVAMLYNISNVFSGSPYLSQIKDIPPNLICNGDKRPKTCKAGKPCFCSHVIHIPLNAVVELVMIDAAPNGLSHPFHLHGFGFYVMAQGLLSAVNINQDNVTEALPLHEQVYGTRNRRPVVKDTLATPSGGYTIVRFLADNPGYWLYHCHFMSHLLVGMELVFHVGEASDVPPVPKGFPKCGDFKPSILRH